MLASLRKALKLKWKSEDQETNADRSLLLIVFMGLLEDVLFWKKTWLSALFILFINILFFIGSYKEIKFSVLCIYTTIFMICIDGLETWLKYKHRTSFLKQLATRNSTQLYNASGQLKRWINKQWGDYMYLREINHTKAFLLSSIFFGTLYGIGTFLSGFMLAYLLCMLAVSFHFTAPLATKLVKRIQIISECDSDLDSLMPQVSDKDLLDLSFEPEQKVDDKQSLDYWKLNDELPGEDQSDSSENSSSLATHLSIEKLTVMDKAETSDSSDDEYIPLVKQKDQLQSTLEIQPADTWGSSAYSVFRNLTGAVTNMVSTSSGQAKKDAFSSPDSSDGFEFIDKKELL